MPLQAKLLRVIQDGVVRRVGSEQQDAVVDVRFISATNREPQEAVDEGVLRGDLFYRLRVVPIKLPPLRKRPEDIPLLANHFLTYYWQRHRQMGDRAPHLSEASIAFLRSRPWRGNVRELQNVIEHVAVLAEPDQIDSAERHSGLRRQRRVAGRECGARWRHGRGLSSGQGPSGGPVREGVSHPPDQPSGGQYVEGRAAREHRPDDPVPADGQARVPARREPGTRGVTPETLLPASTSGERRRVAQEAPGRSSLGSRRSPAGSLAPVLWDALRESVLWAEAEWERVVEHAAGADEVTAHLAQLCAAIRQEAAGSTSDTSALPRNALSRRLLGLIRTAFVDRARALPDPDPGPAAPDPSAIEVVGQHLEADWSQHFTDRLSAPDGLELVVEVAHDLRSPLTSILFLAETLQRGRSGPVNPVQERQLGLIYSAAFGLSSVASDVIELARAATGWSTWTRFRSRSPTSWNRSGTSCSRSPRRKTSRCGLLARSPISGSAIRWR